MENICCTGISRIVGGCASPHDFPALNFGVRKFRKLTIYPSWCLAGTLSLATGIAGQLIAGIPHCIQSYCEFT